MGQVVSLWISPSQCCRTFSYKYQVLSALRPGLRIISGSVMRTVWSFSWSFITLTLNSAEEGNSLMNTLPGFDEEKRKWWYLVRFGIFPKQVSRNIFHARTGTSVMSKKEYCSVDMCHINQTKFSLRHYEVGITSKCSWIWWA